VKIQAEQAGVVPLHAIPELTSRGTSCRVEGDGEDEALPLCSRAKDLESQLMTAGGKAFALGIGFGGWGGGQTMTQRWTAWTSGAAVKSSSAFST